MTKKTWLILGVLMLVLGLVATGCGGSAPAPAPAPAPQQEEPKEEPKAEESAEQPAEEPAAEEPKVEEPKAEEPKKEEPKKEEPKASGPGPIKVPAGHENFKAMACADCHTDGANLSDAYKAKVTHPFGGDFAKCESCHEIQY